MTSQTSNEKSPIAMDGGWGWVVVAGAFLAYFIADGWSYSFGAIYPILLHHFQESSSKTALIAALLYGVPLLISPIICALTNIYGCRVIGITGGLITGSSFILSSFANSIDVLCFTTGFLSSIGLAMTYLSSLVSVTMYFDKKRGIATGLAVTGSGLGAFSFPPLLDMLLNEYSWRGTLLILGAICYHIILAGIVFVPLPLTVSSTNQKEKNPDSNLSIETVDLLDDTEISHQPGNRNESSHASEGNPSTPGPQSSHDLIEPAQTKATFKQETEEALKGLLDKDLFKNYGFLLFCGSSFLLYLWVGIPYVYLVDKALNLGIDITRATFLLSCIGISRTVGQIALGYLGDFERLSTIGIYAGSLMIAGAATVTMPFYTSYGGLIFFSSIFGFFVSVTYSLQMMCVVDIAGFSKTTNAFGIAQLFQGVATLLGTPIAGWLFDKTGSYDYSFYIAGAGLVISGLMLLPLVPKSFKSQEKSQENSDDNAIF